MALPVLSVAKPVGWVVFAISSLQIKFTAKSHSDRIFMICQHMTLGELQAKIKKHFTARCYASAVGLLALALCLSVCLSVRHKSEFY